MSEHKHHFTHESLSLHQANSYNLLLQINANSFNYAIVAGKQLLTWVENYPIEELKDHKALRDILTANYKQVIIGLASTGFTLIPRNLFEEEHVADVARLLDLNDHENVYYQPIDKENIIVYKVDQYLTSNLADFDSPNINYNASGWVKAIATSKPADTNLYINIAEDVAEFLHFANGKLRFYNTFIFKNHEELAYYANFVSHELKLDPQNTTLVLSGEINSFDKCFTFLSNFFTAVMPNDIKLLDLPQKVEAHKILSLASLLLCASSEEN